MSESNTKQTEALSFAPTETKAPPEGKAPQPFIAARVSTQRREGVRIKLVGEIDPTKGPVSLTAVKNLVLRQPEETPKTIVINSSGGNIDEAFRIFEFLHALPVPLATVADQYCRSAAMIVFMSANLRIANPGTELLLHGTHMGKEDLPSRLNARALQRYADDLKSDDDRILDLLEARTGFDRSEFEAEMSDERAMLESFAVSSGVIHEWPGSNRCDPIWPDTVRQIQAAGMILPRRLTSPNYFTACREAAHFPVID